MFQTLLFGYIFAFHLPKYLVNYLGTGGYLSFPRGIGRAAHGRHRDEYQAQESLAAMFGPGVIEVESIASNGESYGNSVSRRAESMGESWWRQTAYYRHGLAAKKWEKSLETIAELYNIESANSAPISPVGRRRSSSMSGPLFGEQYHGALKAPTTILWGENDIAISKTICLDGISDYLSTGSEVIMLPETGHWTPVEKESRTALAAAIEVFTAPDSDPPNYIADQLEKVYKGAIAVVKK